MERVSVTTERWVERRGAPRWVLRPIMVNSTTRFANPLVVANIHHHAVTMLIGERHPGIVRSAKIAGVASVILPIVARIRGGDVLLAVVDEASTRSKR